MVLMYYSRVLPPVEAKLDYMPGLHSIRTSLLIPLKAWGGKSPHEMTPSSHCGVADPIENSKRESANIEPINTSPQLQLRHRCLQRDGNKCLTAGELQSWPLPSIWRTYNPS
jgi:hypothetical protein